MFCKVKDLEIYYEIHGEGIPIVMLHGFTPDHRLTKGCFEPVFARRQGWQRIYFDLPGMGKTAGKDWLDSSDKMLDVVIAFIEQVIPGQSFLLTGESYGGYLARGLVHRMPGRLDGVCLLCPLIVPGSRDLPRQTVLVRDNALLADLSQEEAGAFIPMAVVQSPLTWQKFRDEIYPGLKLADRAFLDRLYRHYAFQFNVDALEKPFEKPSLFLMGRQDFVVGYHNAWNILENYPRATFAVLDRAGHNAQIEQEALFESLVSEWLDRVMENLKRT